MIRAVIFAGSGSLTAASGGGADTFVFHAGAGLMISFGTDATHGILLQGATSLGQTVLHPI